MFGLFAGTFITGHVIPVILMSVNPTVSAEDIVLVREPVYVLAAVLAFLANWLDSSQGK